MGFNEHHSLPTADDTQQCINNYFIDNLCHKIKINSLNKKEWFSLMKTLLFHEI